MKRGLEFLACVSARRQSLWSLGEKITFRNLRSIHFSQFTIHRISKIPEDKGELLLASVQDSLLVKPPLLHVV